MMSNRLLLIRLGAIGDQLITSSLYRLLKEDGYHVTCYMKKQYADTLKNCPYIDEFRWHDENIPLRDCPAKFEEISKGYDKVINLSGSLEASLLVAPDDPRFSAPKEARDTDTNYYDYCLTRAGYAGRINHPKPVVWMDNNERGWVAYQRHHYHDSFVLYWALSGSGPYKTWPFAEDVGKQILQRHKNVTIVTSGSADCKLLEGWGHKRAIHKSGEWSLRSSMLFTYVADCVIGPETGIVHAAAANGVPKIVLLTHSNHNNLTKYFDNVYPLQSEAVCSPCHRLMSYQESKFVCKVDEEWNATHCMMRISPERVLATFETVLSQSHN